MPEMRLEPSSCREAWLERLDGSDRQRQDHRNLLEVRTQIQARRGSGRMTAPRRTGKLKPTSYLTISGFLFLASCGSSTPPVSGVPKLPPAVPKPSGNPIISYRLVNSQQKSMRRPWMHVVLGRRPTEHELIDLALELHKRHPDTRFNICDNPSGLKQLDQNTDNYKTVPYPAKWAKKHYFAMVNIFVEGGQWKWRLGGCDAHPTKADQRICDLEDNGIDPSEYARKHGDPE
jgi:hypothetical protein